MNTFSPFRTTYGDINAGRAYYNGGSGGQGGYMPTQARQAVDEQRAANAAAAAKAEEPQPMSQSQAYGQLAQMGNTAAQKWVDGHHGMSQFTKALPSALGGMGQPYAGPQSPGYFQEPDPMPSGGGMSDPFGGGYKPNRRDATDPFNKDRREPGVFAEGGEVEGGEVEGGEVEGPGGPKDDKVPAMLSDGEFVMPAEAVKFYGLDKLNKMRIKAKEGLMEIPDGEHGGMENGKGQMPMMHMAGGGFVNPYADDPVGYARSQYDAANAQPQADGIADMGGGQKVLANKSGTGYAAQPGGAGYVNGPAMFNDQGNAMRVTPGQGMAPIPDVIPAGPWAAPALPYDAKAQRDSIAFVGKQMEQGADARRTADDMRMITQAALTPKGRSFITVPDATVKFPGTGEAGGPSGNPFLAPWEKRDAAKMYMAANDAAMGRPDGMRQTDWNHLKRDPKFLLGQQEARGARVFAPAVDPAGNPIPGVLVNNKGVQARAAARGPGTASRVAALERVMSEDTNMGNREKARREWETLTGVARTTPANPAKAAKDVKSPVVGESEARGADGKLGIKFMTHEDGSKSVDGVATEPTDEQKRAAFKFMTGRELPEHYVDDKDWSDAWYYATGQRPQPRAASATKPAGKIKSVTEVK